MNFYRDKSVLIVATIALCLIIASGVALGQEYEEYDNPAYNYSTIETSMMEEQTDEVLQASKYALLDSIYTIQQKSSDRYLDAYQSESADFDVVTRLFQGNRTQEWLILSVPGQQNTYTIQQLSSLRFLDAYQTADHDFSVVTRTEQGNTTQMWLIIPIEGEPSVYAIQQASNRRFLDAYQSDADDYNVVTRDFQGNSTQNWIILESP